MFSDISGQNQQTDSVLQIVKKNTHDTTEVKALLWLGVKASNDNIQSSGNYFKQALRLSEEISSRMYITESCIELGRFYHANGQSDSSLVFHRKALSLAPPKSAQAVDAYQGIALNLLWMSRFDSARINLQKALVIAQEINDYSLQAGIYNDMGNLSLTENNHLGALQEYLLSAKLQDSLLQDPVGQARALLNIGNIQYNLQHYDKAIQYATEAQQIADKNNYHKGVAYASQLMGRVYRSQQKLDLALAEFTKAMDQYIRMGDKRSAAETELSIGNIYYDKSDFRKAQAHYFNALQQAKSISNETLKVYTYSALGYVFYEQKLYKEAILYVDSSRVTALTINDQYSVLDAYKLLLVLHKDQHQYKEALGYSELYAALSDSLIKAGNQTKMDELEVIYQNEKKAAEIELLKSDQKQQQTIQIATIIVLALVIVVALVLINRYRVLNRVKRMVEIERVRNGIARDLHDDVGSTLSSINILSQVALAEKNRNVESYLQRIGDQSARMMEDIGDIVWSINPNNDSIHKVIVRMREFANEILEPKSIRYHFTEKISEGLHLDADKRKNLFLIFKESINNAAKYSQANELEISLHQEDHSLVMQVKDNGQGFDDQSVKLGNGLNNMSDRASEINGSVTIKSQLQKGTLVELRMPLA
ncbi:MAG TPA: tetratricopeptide repeat protein [Ohtaekwangia sp.]